MTAVREAPGAARLRATEPRAPRNGSVVQSIVDQAVEPMAEDEARECVRTINHQLGNARRYILQLHDRRGWAALGYASWEACVTAEFGQHRSTLFRQLQAADVERQLGQSQIATNGVADSTLRALAPLPPTERLEVARAVDLASVSTRELRQTIKDRRVQRVRDARRDMLATATESPLLHTQRFACVQADCNDLPEMYMGTDLIVTSPPYGLELEGSDLADDGHDWAEYLVRAETWAREMYRVVNPDHGRLCLNIPLDRSKGSREPVYADWVQVLRRAGWRYESTIVWKEGNTSNHQARGSVASPNAPHAVAPVEMILVMYRGEWSLGEPQRPSDVSELEWVDWLSTTWTFAGEHRYRVGHMAPFPEELARRCILLYSFPGALIGDPFSGSGTTAVAALKAGRGFRGSDVDPECVELTRARVAREVAA